MKPWPTVRLGEVLQHWECGRPRPQHRADRRGLCRVLMRPTGCTLLRPGTGALRSRKEARA
jgi:hypothetical protein